MSKKLIALGISLFFYIAVIFAQTAVAPAHGDGSEENPYQIATWQNLYWITQNTTSWDKHFIQTDSIDLSLVSPAINTWDSNQGWTPIGNYTNKFTGTYNGQNYSINGIFLERELTDYVGFFGYCSLNTEICNVKLTNVDITGKEYAGGLAGMLFYSSLKNSTVDGSVVSTRFTGGLIGVAHTSDISQCSSSGTVTGLDSYFANTSTGGLVGSNYLTTLAECYSSSQVTNVKNQTGGLVGRNYDATIMNSYSIGSVLGNDYVGGLTGENNGVSGKIINSYSTGAVSGNGTNVGGLVGYSEYDTKIYYCFWDTLSSGQVTSAGGFGKTTAEMKTQSTFDDQGWSFVHKWSIDDGYPYLQLRSDPPVAVAPLVGDGSESSPYQISNLSELYWISQDNSRASLHYIQTSDIDAIQTGALINGWTPIGYFTGTYNGQNYIISNLYVGRPANSYSGLFGRGSWAEIRNTHLSNVEISGGIETGGLVGSDKNSSIENCSVDGSVIGSNNVGVLIGKTSSSIISKCSVSGTATGTSRYTGGLIGYNGNYSSINECFSSVMVNNYISSAGGLAGYNEYGTISESYSIGSVEGLDYVGGLVGFNSRGSITDCYSTGSVEGNDYIGGLTGYNSYIISNCYSVGIVNGIGSNMGGLVGGESDYYADCSASFWDTETSGLTSSAGGNGKTTARMKMQSTFADSGWNFNSTWFISYAYNYGYPDLLWQIDPVSPEIVTDSVAAMTKESALIQYTITEHGLPKAFQHGVCWDTTGIPDVDDHLTNEGPVDSSGVYASLINGLSANTQYIVRSYIMSSIDTVYGDTLSFKTYENPSLSMVTISDIDTSSAKFCAEVLNMGNPTPSGHGFLWWMDDGTDNITNIHLGAVDSIGIFCATATDLHPNKDYIALAYVATPGDTIITDTSRFKTLGYPEVTTVSVSDIGISTASVNGLLDEPGNPAATQHGVCWSTAIDPTIGDRKVELGPIDSTYSFNIIIDSLKQHTVYYVCAFATNDIGTVYGDTLSFATLGTPSVTEIRVSEIDTNSFIANADIISLGNPAAGEHGFAWAADTGSALIFNNVFLGTPDSIGTYSAVIGGLEPNNAYQVYAFISNANDTVHTDTMLVGTYGLPSVSILSVSDIDSVSITVNGKIDMLGNPGILQHGFCWSTDINPTIEDNMIDLGTIDSMSVFNAVIDSLTQNTLYYIRSFASNEVGVAYSDTLSFITLETSIYDMIPVEFNLAQNYPNPFNPTTTFQYGLPEMTDVKLIIFDMLGRKVKEWTINGQNAGWYKLVWNGTDYRGNMVSTGVYIYMMKAGDFVESRKMVFMK